MRGGRIGCRRNGGDDRPDETWHSSAKDDRAEANGMVRLPFACIDDRFLHRWNALDPTRQQSLPGDRVQPAARLEIL